MPTLRLDEIVKATGGYLVRGDPSATVDSYAIDTRALSTGGLFFALAGSRTDGHEFLGKAAQRGATAACVRTAPGPDAEAPASLILVEDTVRALANCGRLAREKLPHVQWIAVTGSNGKTATKELIAAGLSATRRTHLTPGNFNNHLGVPLSLLACPDDAETAVLELAMSATGEIAELAAMVQPSIALVTNVRAVHLEYFSSLDDIAAAKGELYARLDEQGIAVVNFDDTQARIQAARHAGPQVTFGHSAGADLHLEEIANRFLPGAALAFTFKDELFKVHLHMGGAHSAFNALAALATVVAAGAELPAAIEKMQRVESGPGRGKIHHLRREILLVDDCYNSSPAALASVLETLQISQPRGRRVLVMGDMLELGDVGEALHREAGNLAAKSKVELLVTVGTLARLTSEAGQRAGVLQVQHYPDSSRAAASIVDQLSDGDLVVVKGSRGIQLERVVQAMASALAEVA